MSDDKPDPYAHLRPQLHQSTPTDSLATAAIWTLVLSLFVFPVALVTVVLGAMLTGRGRTFAGVAYMVLGVVVVAGWVGLLAAF